LSPFLRKPGLVDDQNTVVLAQMFHHIITHLIAQQFGVPVAAPQQVLDFVRCLVPQALGHLPAILALDGTEQGLQVAFCLLAQFDSGTGAARCD
jgi:hypothetical protein